MVLVRQMWPKTTITYINNGIYNFKIEVGYCTAQLRLLLRALIPLTKTIAAQNEVALSYHLVRGLCLMAVVFVTTIINTVIISLTAILYFCIIEFMILSINLFINS